MPDSRAIPSLAALLLANLIPLIGVIFFGWDGWVIIAAYFVETMLIGVLNVVKMGLVLRYNPEAETDITGPKGVGLILFFIGHYGFFILVQLGLFSGIATSFSSAFPDEGWFGIAGFLGGALAREGRLIVIALGLGLVANFVLEFLLPGAYRTVKAGRQMFEPYIRVLVQQFVVIFGGFLMLLLNSPMPVVILLILLKTIADILGDRQWLSKIEQWQVVLPGDVPPPPKHP